MKEGMKEGGDKMTPEMKKMAEDMANQMKPKMKAAMSKSCKDDKWSGDALKCMDDAKTMDEMEKCEAKLTPDQKKNMDKAMNDGDGHGRLDRALGRRMAGSAAAPAGSGAAPAAGGGDLPAECNDYKAAIDKLAACDKMPQQARDALKNAYDQAAPAGRTSRPRRRRTSRPLARPARTPSCRARSRSAAGNHPLSLRLAWFKRARCGGPFSFAPRNSVRSSRGTAEPRGAISFSRSRSRCGSRPAARRREQRRHRSAPTRSAKASTR